MVSATCRYSSACRPLVYSKCPSRKPPVLRSSATTSSWVGTSCIEFGLRSVRAAAQHLGNGPQKNLPIERQRPVVNVLHVELHPCLKIDVVPAAHCPQARQARAHTQPPALPALILFHFL